MCSLFREKLNLPIEEEMESHLYENVTVACSNEDSDSDNSLSPSLAIVADPLDHKMTDRKEKFPQSAPVKERDGRQKSPVSEPAVSSDQKRLNQITQQSSDNRYINVSFDLIDLSDDTSAENPPKTRSNANTARTSKSHFTSPLLLEKVSQRRSSRFPEKRDTVDGGHPDARPEKPSSGFPVVRQDSDEYVVMPNRSRSPVEPFETSEYIIPSRRYLFCLSN